MASTIPTHSTGDYLSSADWNTVVPLNTQVAMYAVGSKFLGGTQPSASAPNWMMQCGYVANPSFATGVATIVYPTPFPNGLMAIQLTPFYSAPANSISLAAGSGTNASQAIVTCNLAGSAYTGTGIGVFYTLIGF